MSFGLGRGRELVTSGWGFTTADLPALEAGRLGPEFFFGSEASSRARRFEIEIGVGKGAFLLQEAPQHSDTLFLGIEYAGEFYRYAADRMRRHAVPNVRVLYGDAIEFIHHRLRDDCVDVIHLYFSDPWPKKRHHKRRVVQVRSLGDFHRVLRPEGEVRLVTDHDELWTWYEQCAEQVNDRFERVPFAQPRSAAEGEVVGTNFERKYQREGRPFHAMTLRRRS
ncbi:MAG: tRNA (guanosine(46)-N7)-methyltransferase TrmB [Phycisphaeraceae bacterium]|nr:tRNA (guanosine(46)-N7)-methyltransferase TrmB [Phycisphaeraceae bacterium]